MVVETLTGEVRIPASEVASIDEKHRSKIEEYYEREKEASEKGDAVSFFHLALWSRENKAVRFFSPNVVRGVEKARMISNLGELRSITELFRGKFGPELNLLWERILDLDPEDETARRELGYRKKDGRWMSNDEFQESIGNVLFEGKWISVEERALILKTRELELEEKAEELRRRGQKLEEAEEKLERDRKNHEVEEKRLEGEERELAEREAKVRALEEAMRRYSRCQLCDSYFSGAHICPRTWVFCTPCGGYFHVGHACRR